MFFGAKQLSFVTTNGSVVQWIEHKNSSLSVEGSNPSRVTTHSYIG